MRVSGLALALVVVCASGCVCAAASQPRVLDESVLSHQYEIVIHPDFEKDAVWVGGSDEVSLPATEYPWVTINLLADCGIAIVRSEDRGFRLLGDCALEARALIGGCEQNGLNTAFSFDAEEGFEVAVLLSYTKLPGGFRVELHSSGKYAHATLAIDQTSSSFYTCCSGCYPEGDCRGAGRDMSERSWWQEQPHVLSLIYNPEDRRVQALVDGNCMGSWSMPQEFGFSHLRLFVDCDAGSVGSVEVDVLDVLIGLGRI